MTKFAIRMYTEIIAKNASEAETILMKSINFENPVLAELAIFSSGPEKVNKEELCEFKDLMKTLKTNGE